MAQSHNIKQEKAMTEKELYQQKKQARLDEWDAEVDKLKARTSGVSADAQLALNRQIEVLEARIKKGKTWLAEIEDASEDAWESIKGDVESAWDSITSGFSDAATKFNK
ncbi:MAG: hypothetical protein ACI9SC_001684 [Gammaproteobacteria bacterium]